MDSCEQPIERPGAYEEQKKYYSGKKKNHTRKNQLIVLPNGKDIVDVIAGQPGPKVTLNYFVKLKTILTKIKSLLEIKLTREKHRLELLRKNRKSEN